MNLADYRTKINQLRTEFALAVRQVEEETRSLEEARTLLQNTQYAQKLCLEIAETLQQSAHQQVAEIVTRCLRAIFGEDSYEFGIEFTQKRGKTEARIFLKKGDLIITDPLNEAGGGVCDVISFALRVACILLSRPQRRKLLVLDECFRGVRGRVYQERVGSLIEGLAQETGIQFLISSDFDWLKVGEVINLD